TYSPPLAMVAWVTPSDYGAWRVDGVLLTPCRTDGCGDITIAPVYRLRFGNDLVRQWPETVAMSRSDVRFGFYLPPDAIDFRMDASQRTCVAAAVACGWAWGEWPGTFAGQTMYEPIPTTGGVP